MAGDWIKVEHGLDLKEEVLVITDLVDESVRQMVGHCPTNDDVATAIVVVALQRFWVWADSNSVDGSNLKVSQRHIDKIAGLPGLAAAMRAVGWLDGRDGALQLPNFQRHNGTSAKARALESEAKRLRRLSDKVSDDTSDSCPTKPAKNVRLEEKRGDLSPIDRYGDESFSEDEVAGIRATASRINRIITLKGQRDRNLVVLAATLLVRKIIPENTIERALESITDEEKKKPTAYFKTCLITQMKKQGMDFHHAEDHMPLPKELLTPQGRNGSQKTKPTA